MDRLTTGRRHVRAGSVHVTELLNKQARTGVPRPAVVTTLDPERTIPLPTSHRQPPSRGAQLAKLTGLGAATLVLCGAMAAGALISDERDGTAAGHRHELRVTGDQALLPDRLDRGLLGSGGAAATLPVPVTARPNLVEPADSPAVPTVPIVAPVPADRSVATPSATPAVRRDDPAGSDVDLVTRFYGLLPSDPDSAFELLAPDVLTATLTDFLRSWSTVSGVEILDIHEQDDEVLAVVRMTLDDGGHLQLQHLLSVADSPHRITGVQLLSAQRN